jgi:hypothetical protein
MEIIDRSFWLFVVSTLAPQVPQAHGHGPIGARHGIGETAILRTGNGSSLFSNDVIGSSRMHMGRIMVRQPPVFSFLFPSRLSL